MSVRGMRNTATADADPTRCSACLGRVRHNISPVHRILSWEFACKVMMMQSEMGIGLPVQPCVVAIYLLQVTSMYRLLSPFLKLEILRGVARSICHRSFGHRYYSVGLPPRRIALCPALGAPSRLPPAPVSLPFPLVTSFPYQWRALRCDAPEFRRSSSQQCSPRFPGPDSSPLGRAQPTNRSPLHSTS